MPPTSIVAIPGGSPNSLVVKHNADVHDQITELLACLRRVRPGDAAQRAGIARDMTPAETRIDDALATRVDLDFNDTPFDKVVGQLKKRFKIEILGDPATLKDGSSIGGEDITRKFRNEPLRSALRKMLGDLRLTFIIRDEVVLITTPEIAASQLSTKVYPLPPDTKPEVVDSLLKEIRGLIAPNSCDGVAVVDLSVPVLIARQTPKIHEAIVKRLARSEFHDAKSK